MMRFRYRDSEGRAHTAEISIIRNGNPTEMDITTDGWVFHVIAGRHRDGNFVCIPNWNIGSELAGLNDRRWNSERLMQYAHMERENAEIVAAALAEVEKKSPDNWMRLS